MKMRRKEPDAVGGRYGESVFMMQEAEAKPGQPRASASLPKLTDAVTANSCAALEIWPLRQVAARLPMLAVGQSAVEQAYGERLRSGLSTNPTAQVEANTLEDYMVRCAIMTRT